VEESVKNLSEHKEEKMAAAAPKSIPQPGQFVASQRLKTVYAVGIFLGLIFWALAFFGKDENGVARAWHSYLTSYMFFTNLALGGLFFAAIQHVAKAGWSVTIRRFMEAFPAFLPVAAVGAIGVLLGSEHLYMWLDQDLLKKDALLAGKTAYLNMPFLIVRLVLFFALWLWFAKLIVGHSLSQDKDGQESHTLKNVGLSVAFLLVFALSYSLFSVDMLMSLMPHWYSTIWGVYSFAGLFQSSLAAMIIFIVYSMKKGWLRGLVTEDHLHDMGKFLKAFTVFYAYIAFSQFLLIWYANIPEETLFYLARVNGGWLAATISLFVFKFAVPFLLLLPRAAKRSPAHLVLVSTLILIMQFVDIHWMVYPNLDSGAWVFGLTEIGAFMMFGGLFLWSVTRFLEKNPLVPVKDPRIGEAVTHHVVY
jgi:hypothetical protein